MATIKRKGRQRSEFEIMDRSPTENVQRESNEKTLTADNLCKEDNEDIPKREDSVILNEKSITPLTHGTLTPERVFTVDCNSCNNTKDMNMIKYCRECEQTLCDVCLKIHNRLGGTRNHLRSLEKCWPESEILDQKTIDQLMKDREPDKDKLSTDLSTELGVQVCRLYDTDVIEVRAPCTDVLELAIDTLSANTKSKMKRVRYGLIEWTLHGYYAFAITKLFKEQLNNLIERYDVSISITRGSETVTWQEWFSGKCNKSYCEIYRQSEEGSCFELKEKIELVMKSSFDSYYAVNCEIEGLKDEVETLTKAEILRQKQDKVRMNLYVIMKENSDEVICHIEETDSVCKLIIQGPEVTTVEKVGQEFLSLFCKECSLCKRESTQPTFLECKHVLCHRCVKDSSPLTDGLRCPVCSDTTRQKTPVPSLQLRCLQVIDNNNLTGKTPTSTRPNGIVRKQSSFSTPQISVKIPKYLLQKWKKLTGGISRLKNIIENTFGLKVTGIDDSIKIYGQIQEILDLAVQSLESFNEKTPETGITQRLAEKCVEWRLRGEHARMAHFLFKKELNNIKKKFNTVSVQAFTESEPSIVDVKCGYEEFLKVKYEIEELENDIRNLYTDECIQPKNFYHSVKIKEYLQSKRRDDKVHCSLVEKNNVNAVVFRGRKKEYITAAKEQLLKW